MSKADGKKAGIQMKGTEKGGRTFQRDPKAEKKERKRQEKLRKKKRKLQAKRRKKISNGLDLCLIAVCFLAFLAAAVKEMLSAGKTDAGSAG